MNVLVRSAVKPAQPGTIAHAVVLRDKGEGQHMRFATHLEPKDNPRGTFWGHYFGTFREAVNDYEARCRKIEVEPYPDTPGGMVEMQPGKYQSQTGTWYFSCDQGASSVLVGLIHYKDGKPQSTCGMVRLQLVVPIEPEDEYVKKEQALLEHAVLVAGAPDDRGSMWSITMYRWLKITVSPEAAQEYIDGGCVHEYHMVFVLTEMGILAVDGDSFE